MENGEEENVFYANSNIIISGATGCGKTHWLYEMLKQKEHVFEGRAPDRILYCYGIYQHLFDEMKKKIKNITFQPGIPSDTDIKKLARKAKHGLIVLDDLMTEVSNDPGAEKLFTQGTHHLGLSVVYIVQNIMYQNKCTRTISLNSQYIVLFRNFRDGAQILHLARQIYPSNPWLLIDAYEDATKKPFGYIVINMHPRYTDDTKRLQTGILPHEERAYYKPM